VLEKYKEFLLKSLQTLKTELDKPEYEGLLDKLTEAETDVEMDTIITQVIEKMKKEMPHLAGQLNEILELYKKTRDGMKEIEDDITDDQRLYGEVLISMMETIGKGFGEALASGFGREGFKKLTENLFQGFKMILIQTLEFIEKEFILCGAKTLLDAILNPVEGTLKGAALVAAEISIQTAKAAINAWVPKFASGGGVTGPTYLLAGENNKKEWILSPEQVTREVREAVAKELIVFRDYYHSISPASQKQSIEVDVRMKPVKLEANGRNMYGIIQQQKKLDSSRWSRARTS